MTIPAASPSASVVLGIDLGTQGLKVIAFDEKATMLGSVSATVENLSPAPGWLEQEADQWWISLATLTRRLLSDCDIHSDCVAGIGLSGHMHSIVPLDAQGQPARNCIVWADTRSGPQARRLAQSGRQLWNPSIAPYSLNKILWLKENQPGVFAAVDRVVFSKDYLRYRMTGALVTDASDASGSLMWDFAARGWDAELLAECGLSPSLLPNALDSSDVAGELTSAAAADLGLARGAVVAVGGGDCACAVVGSGIPAADTLLINAGTAVQVIEMRAKPTVYDRASGSRYLFELGVDGKVFAIGALNSAGHSLEWWRRLLDAEMSYAEFDALAAQAQPSPKGPIFLPWLQGSGTPNLLDGAHGGFAQLSAQTDQSAMTRAVMEGVAFGIKHCAEALIGDGSLQGKQIIFSGGLGRGPLMRRILADVFGATLRFREFSDMSALGAAAHAAVAAGWADDAAVWLAEFDYGEIAQEPDEESAAVYSRMYLRYKQLAQRVAGD